MAALQRQIAAAEGSRQPITPHSPITTADYGRTVWSRYQAILQADEETRAAYPSEEQIKAAIAEAIERIQRYQIDITDPLAMLDTSLDLQILKDRSAFDAASRQAKLDALRSDLGSAPIDFAAAACFRLCEETAR